MKLNSREKRLTIILTGIIVLWICYIFLVAPARARVKTLNRVIPDKIEQYNKLRQLTLKYQEISGRLSEIKRKISSQPADFNLLPFVEKLTRQCNLSDKKAAMTRQTQPLNDIYTENTVSLQLNNITMKQLINFLNRMTTDKTFINIKSLELLKSDIPTSGLNCKIQISAVKLNKK